MRVHSIIFSFKINLPKLEDTFKTINLTKLKTQTFWNIPNTITLYRLIVFPVILYFILTQQEYLFSIFITISLISDILDGLFARVLKMQTAVGAKLDSWADTGTYILAFLAIYVFKWEEIKQHLFPFVLFIAAMIISYAIVFIKFKGLIGLHTYLFKITGYLQGAFIIVFFMWDFYAWLYYVAIFCGVAACIEEIIIMLMISQPVSNVKGLYWLIKKSR